MFHKSLVTEAKETRDTKPLAKSDIPQIVRIAAPQVNIRELPNANSNVVKVALSGAEFKEVADKSTLEYAAISIQGDVAYVKRDFIDIFDNPAYKANQLAGKLG